MPISETINDTISLTSSFSYITAYKIDLHQNISLISSFRNGTYHLYFTDIWYPADAFGVITHTRNPSFSDGIVLNSSFKIGKTLTLHIDDTLEFQEPFINHKIDNKITVVIPSFIIYPKDYPTYIVLTSQYGTILLSNPIFGDSESIFKEVKILRTVSGKKYSYLKTLDIRSIKYEFNFRYTKYLELKNFIDASNLLYFTLINWKGETWYVQLVNNPLEYTAIDREFYSVSLEFQGYLVIGGDYRCRE